MVQTHRSFQNSTSIFYDSLSIRKCRPLVIPKCYIVFLFCFLKYSIDSRAASQLILLLDETIFPLLRAANIGISLAVQWLGLRAATAGVTGSIPGSGN